jgi:hypothetical protein
LPKHNTFFVRRILLSREAIERDREKVDAATRPGWRVLRSAWRL